MPRESTLRRSIGYISPTNFRPTKEMLEKFEKDWLPMRKKTQEKKEEKKHKKVFLIYGDFDIIEVDDETILENAMKKSKKLSSTKKHSSAKNHSSTKKHSKKKDDITKKVTVVEGKKRTWKIEPIK